MSGFLSHGVVSKLGPIGQYHYSDTNNDGARERVLTITNQIAITVCV